MSYKIIYLKEMLLGWSASVPVPVFNNCLFHLVKINVYHKTIYSSLLARCNVSAVPYSSCLKMLKVPS